MRHVLSTAAAIAAMALALHGCGTPTDSMPSGVQGMGGGGGRSTGPVGGGVGSLDPVLGQAAGGHAHTPEPPTGPQRTGAPDFDGDGRSDIAVYFPDGGRWSIRSSLDGAESSEDWGWIEAVPTPGDYDGDGKTDLAVYLQRTGQWWVRRSSDGELMDGAPIDWGWVASVPVVGDYDGDGRTDLAVYDPESANWYVRRSSDGNQLGGGPLPCGPSRSRPVAGDYDGDGKTDLAVFEPADANWYVCSSGEQWLDGAPPVQFGWDQTVPVPGDYDGDGRTDLAVYHPAGADWFVRESDDGSMLEGGAIHFGPVDAMPVIGDYDGDGKSDLALYHYRTGAWHIRQSADQTLYGDEVIEWGGDESVPVGAALKGVLWGAQLSLPSTPQIDGIDNHLEGNEAAAIPIALSYDRDWIIDVTMVGVNGGGGQRYLTFDKGSHPDVFPYGNILALRVYNRSIWLLKNPLVGGGHALYPSYKRYTGTIDDEGNADFMCDETMTSGELCNADHVGATLSGDYVSGDHSMRLEYIRSKSRSGNTDEGVFRFYWDGQLVGDWNTWEQQLPPPMTRLYVGRVSGGTIRYYQGWFQSVIGAGGMIPDDDAHDTPDAPT